MKQDREEVNKKKKIQKNRKINGKIKKSNDRGPFQQTKHASSSSTHTQTDRKKYTVIKTFVFCSRRIRVKEQLQNPKANPLGLEGWCKKKRQVG